MYETSFNIPHEIEYYLATDLYLSIGFQTVFVSRAI